MKSAAACPHHWIALEVSAEPISSDKLIVRLGCIMCFKWANATFDHIGYHLDAKTARAQRAAKKDLKR